jgi:hypothetical protein
MPCNLYVTFRGKIRGETYKSLDDLLVAYEGAKVKYQPACAYDEAGALIRGAEPEGFEQPGRLPRPKLRQPTETREAS